MGQNDSEIFTRLREIGEGVVRRAAAATNETTVVIRP